MCVCAPVLHSGLTCWVKLTNTLLAVTQSAHWKIIHKLWRLNTDVCVPLETLPICPVTNQHWSDIDCQPQQSSLSVCSRTGSFWPMTHTVHRRSGSSHHCWYEMCDHFKDHMADTPRCCDLICVSNPRPESLPAPSIYLALEQARLKIKSKPSRADLNAS